jgi:hypothetical protein
MQSPFKPSFLISFAALAKSGGCNFWPDEIIEIVVQIVVYSIQKGNKMTEK